MSVYRFGQRGGDFCLWRWLPVVLLAVFCYAAQVNARPARKFVVVLDAGHGGHDVGAEGTFSNEKDINLNITLEVERLVKAHLKDVKLILTRRSDIYLSYEERVRLANRNHADLFLSIHTNSSEESRVARGVESYYALLPAPPVKKGRVSGKAKSSGGRKINVVADAVQSRTLPRSELFARLMQRSYLTYGRRVNRGVKRESYYVLVHTSMPSVLTEVGFISTLDEESYLTSKKGVREVSQSICHAIGQYKSIVSNGKYQDELALLRRGKQPKTVKNISFAMERLSETSTGNVTAKEKRATDESPSKASKASAVSAAADKGQKADKENKALRFGLQILTSTEELALSDYCLKGMKPVTFIKCGKIYKCLYLLSADYDAVRAAQKTVREKFADAFVVAFKGEEQIPTADAIREFKETRQKTNSGVRKSGR